MKDEDPMADRKKTIAERKAELEVSAELLKLKRDWAHWQAEFEMIPTDWRRMEKIAPCTTPKKKLTVTLDQDVVKFYRSLGRGYQGRMNAILRTFMLARISKLIEEFGDKDKDGKML